MSQLPRLPSPRETSRPHTLAEWRTKGLDYALDKGIDIAGVLISVFIAWMLVRVIARRIERWGRREGEGLRSAREQRARTAANLVRRIACLIATASNARASAARSSEPLTRYASER